MLTSVAPTAFFFMGCGAFGADLESGCAALFCTAVRLTDGTMGTG